MDEEITFQVYSNSLGFIAIDSNGNEGYGDTADAAIADLQLAYDDANFEVFDFTFTPEGE